MTTLSGEVEGAEQKSTWICRPKTKDKKKKKSERDEERL